MPFPIKNFEFPKGVSIYFQEVHKNSISYRGEFISDKEKVGYFDRNPKLFAIEKTKTDLLVSHFGENVLLEKQASGKPLPINGQCISLSHSGDLVALATSISPVGIDLQEFSPKLERIRAKFVSENEEQLMSESLIEFNPIHFLWCAKEAVFKIYGENLPFKHIEAQRLDLSKNGSITFSLNNGNTHQVYYSFFGNFCFAVAI